MNYETLINPTLRGLRPSGIRKFFDIANEMEDVITLSIGEPDFSTPWHIRQEGIRSLEKGKTWYTANAGLLRLREAIAGYTMRHIGVAYEPKTEVLVTVGGSEAIDLCLRALVCPGDEVLIPQPSFVCYEPLTVMAGGTAVPIVTKAEDGFRLTAEALRAALTPKTKLLILPYPNNPTGGVMRKEHLEAIAAVLRDTDVMVLSDEIYGGLTYGSAPHVSIASLPGMRERTVLVDGHPMNSCLVLVAELDGKHVLTVEGLARDGRLHPLQEAFLEVGAVQCGYCTPGMLLSGIALLNLYPHPTREQIRKEMEGNICRCTGYARIADAIQLAAERINGKA